jgi:hypothetical protein
VAVQWEGEPQPRVVRLVSESARTGDPVRVTAAGVEVDAASRRSSAQCCECALVVGCLFTSCFLQVFLGVV